MSQTWILVIISTLFLMGTTIIFLVFGYTILMLWICKKTFFVHHFLYNYVLLWNKSNLDTRNNLHSFFLWALQSCFLYPNTQYWCFGFTRKAFLFTIFRIINVYLWNTTNLGTNNNLYFFFMGTTIMLFSLGYTY